MSDPPRLHRYTTLALIESAKRHALPPIPEALHGQAVQAQRQFVRVEGPKAAAWLIWIARRHLHGAGAVDYHFRPGEKEPRYFLYAMALLRMRPRWRVEEREAEDGGKDYRVTWRRWHTTGAQWRAEAAAQKRRARNARKRAEKAWFGR